ncbi:MAG: hypothetical protein HYS57_01440 [Parcubacteria group bacterium]|nr:hypothetical protein [Parcubacteria group bacterium]
MQGIAFGAVSEPQRTPPTHLSTPKTVKGIYINLGIINSPRFWRLVEMVERTELNTLVIDIRSGGGPILLRDDQKSRELLTELHARNIYLIARLVAFKGGGGGWYDPASRKRWNDIARIARRAIELGFDEVNFDYVRFGAVNEPRSATPISERTAIIRTFFRFLRKEVAEKTGRPISVDIFGATFIWPQHTIGQRLEDAAESFDYVIPMPYPSHWGPGSFGLANPAYHPYQTVYRSLTQGWRKVENNPKRIASLRSWIQAFDLDSSRPMRRYKYTPWHIREQIRACYDVARPPAAIPTAKSGGAGCTGWILWNAANVYDESSFLKEK